MKRLAELLELYLETEDRDKLNEDSYKVFTNRMKSIRDSSLNLEEFVQLSEYYNNLYQLEHDFIQLLLTDQKIEDIKNDFKLNEREIKDIYEKHSKSLYDQEYKTSTESKKKNNLREKTYKYENKEKSTDEKINKDKTTVDGGEKKTKKDHECSCGGNCGTKGKTENKKSKTLEEIIKDLSEEFKNSNTPKNTKLNSNKDLNKVFLKVFKILNDPSQHVSKEKAENLIEEMIKDIFG